MKRYLLVLMLCMLAIPNSVFALGSTDSWKHWYGVGWNNEPGNGFKYAKNMGYKAAAIAPWEYLSILNSIAAEDKQDMNFYFLDPFYNTQYTFNPAGTEHPYLLNLSGTTKWGITPSSTWTGARKNFYQDYMAWGNTSAFPSNMITGYFADGDGGVLPHPVWDVQQDRVINYLIDKIIERAAAFEAAGDPYNMNFAGILIDVPRIYGDIHVSAGDYARVRLGNRN